MDKSIVMSTPAAVEVQPEPVPITPEWVVSGTPVSRIKQLARSRDLTSNMLVWECTAGSFHWHYCQDETVVIVSGEVFITDSSGKERRLGPGDFVFFPAGTSSTWRVPQSVRKVALVREPMWRPLGIGLKALVKILRAVGLAAPAPLTLVLAAGAALMLGEVPA